MRDLLQRGGERGVQRRSGGREDWFGEGGMLSGRGDGDDHLIDEDELPIITILDLVDHTPRLNELLQSSIPLEIQSSRQKSTDPRAQAFTKGERTVAALQRSGQLRIVVGDVRDQDLVNRLVGSGSIDARSRRRRKKGKSGQQTGYARGGIPIRTPRQKGAGRVSFGGNQKDKSPLVTGIIHLAAYNPSTCRYNPRDCEDVETGGMDRILQAMDEEGDWWEENERPWIVVPRRGDGWIEVGTILHFSSA